MGGYSLDVSGYTVVALLWLASVPVMLVSAPRLARMPVWPLVGMAVVLLGPALFIVTSGLALSVLTLQFVACSLMLLLLVMFGWIRMELSLAAWHERAGSLPEASSEAARTHSPESQSYDGAGIRIVYSDLILAGLTLAFVGSQLWTAGDPARHALVLERMGPYWRALGVGLLSMQVAFGWVGMVLGLADVRRLWRHATAPWNKTLLAPLIGLSIAGWLLFNLALAQPEWRFLLGQQVFALGWLVCLCMGIIVLVSDARVLRMRAALPNSSLRR